MKADEINRLENASEKIYFHPTDNSISDIAGNLSKDNTDRKYWEQKLSGLNKGQCIVHGHLRNSLGEVYSAKPVCVDISAISIDSKEVSIVKNLKNSNYSTETLDFDEVVEPISEDVTMVEENDFDEVVERCGTDF